MNLTSETTDAQSPAAVQPDRLRARIEARLAALLRADSSALGQAMQHALLGPGKRLRPLLTILAGRDLRADERALLDAGCALEMVHAASLVLDDLPAMDDAAERRGRPSTHRMHGEDIAILAAVALLARAFAVVNALPGIDARQRGACAAVLAEAVGRLTSGQLQDLHGGSSSRTSALQRLERCCELKTGVLFVAAMDLAALIADRDDERVRHLRQYAEHLGKAYQIVDDLDDGDEDGAKATTFVSLLGERGAAERLRWHVDAALSRPEVRAGALGRFAVSLLGPHLNGAERAA